MNAAQKRLDSPGVHIVFAELLHKIAHDQPLEYWRTRNCCSKRLASPGVHIEFSKLLRDIAENEPPANRRDDEFA